MISFNQYKRLQVVIVLDLEVLLKGEMMVMDKKLGNPVAIGSDGKVRL